MNLLPARLLGAKVAHFSMEVGLDPAIQTYSGGLGVLVGDHARAAADLGLPMVFVALVSRQGYLQQRIDADGHQVDAPAPWDPASRCIRLAPTATVAIEGRTVHIAGWLHIVRGEGGNEVSVILLDTLLDENDPRDRSITDRLYGGDAAYRLKQEMVLGIGGLRLLQDLGYQIERYHLNEGHSALLALELLHQRRAAGDDGPDGYDFVRSRCVFTTHTPVGAGHDRFAQGLVSQIVGDSLDIDALKRFADDDALNMTRLAIGLSGYVNAVSRRHAEVTRAMFPGVIVRAITNGVHAPTWAHPAFRQLFDAAAPGWRLRPQTLARSDAISDIDLLAAKQAAKADLLRLVESRTGVRLVPGLPLFAYARRMTPYKRPLLLLSELARLRAIAARWPFQVVWAGKAHPADGGGKVLIADLHAAIAALGPDVPMAFLPGYGLDEARALVAGADIWLNTPQPPLEASGTSGMKAAVNGTINLSTLDGWWLEGWDEGITGWAIGEVRGSATNQEAANSLYDAIEAKVLPLYYDDQSGWASLMRGSIIRLVPIFNSHRVMSQYAREAYFLEDGGPDDGDATARTSSS